MTLSEEARERLADVVELQPTKNAELAERWGMESGSEVHRFLESELEEYYYRDDNSLVRATEEAADLVDVEPGIEGDEEVRTVRVPELQARVLDAVAEPDERSQSVVSVLHDLRDQGVEATADDVRAALRDLANKGVLTTVQRSVPTYKLTVARDDLTVEVRGERDTGDREEMAELGRIESDFEAAEQCSNN